MSFANFLTIKVKCSGQIRTFMSLAHSPRMLVAIAHTHAAAVPFLHGVLTLHETMHEASFFLSFSSHGEVC